MSVESAISEWGECHQGVGGVPSVSGESAISECGECHQ